jgi:rRNA maturation endonuclease Nob1
MISINREVIWHFTCEKCKNWWSKASSDDWMPSGYMYCPSCGHVHNLNNDIEEALEQYKETNRYTRI